MTRLLLPDRLFAPASTTRPGWRRAAAVLALAALVGWANARYAAKASKPSRLGTQTRTAFLRWRDQIQGLGRGEDIYKAYNYPNPPVMALILRPLTELPPVAGGLAWLNLKIVLAGFVFVWAFRLVDGRGPPAPGWAKLLAAGLALHPVLGDLDHGNVNIFIAFLVVGSLELLRRRRDAAAGLVLALAVACKVTPALFLPYLVWKRAWRAAAGAAVGLGLWLAVVPGAVLGAERNVELLTSWFDGMVRPFLLAGRVTAEHANQSVPGVVFRLLTSEPSAVGYDDDGKPFPAEFHTVWDAGAPAARWVVRGFQAAFVLAAVTLCRAPAGTRQGLRFAAECSLIVLGMLLFSERTWKHHGVTLILPYAVLTGFLAADPGGRRWAAGVLGLAGALTVGPSLVGGDFQDAALAYGSHTAGFLVLAAGVCGVMWHESRAAARPVEE